MKQRKTLNRFFKVSLSGGIAIGAAILAAGCSGLVSAEGEDPGGEETAAQPWQYVEGRGVKLDETAREIAGIELADVFYGETGGGKTIEVTAQVFSAADERGVARGHAVLPAARAAGLDIGMTVSASRPGDPDGITGEIERLSERNFAAGGQIEIDIGFEDPDGVLREGTFLVCRIRNEGAGSREGLVIPASALLSTARGDFVYVVNGAHFFRSPVEVASRGTERLEVIDGLFEGDAVVSAGTQHLWLVELMAINGGESCADGH